MGYISCSYSDLLIIKENLGKNAVQLNIKQLNQIVSEISSVRIPFENKKSKAVVASILDKLEARQNYLEKNSNTLISADTLSQLRERFEIPTIDKEALHNKFKRAVSRATVIGKGATLPGAKIMHEKYWIEAITFQIEGKTVRFYGRKLLPHFLSWKNSKETRDFQTFMQEKINHMDEQELHEIKKIRLKLLTSKELKKHEAKFIKGEIHVGNQRLHDGEYIFVTDPRQKHFYVGKKKSGYFQHSSFLKGGAIGSAGLIKISHGKVIGIRNHSGHYRPSKDSLDPALKLLKPALKLKKGITSYRKSRSKPRKCAALWQRIHILIVSLLKKIKFIKV